MEYRKLGETGLEVSELSLGASSLGSVFRKVNKDEGVRTVHVAIENGINLIDVSPYYGLTKAETVLGEAISQVQRERIILSTKAGRYGDNSFDFSPRRIKKSIDESLIRLKTDYIDILHLHDIEFGSLDEIINDSLPALEELKKEGKIRFFGVSGLPLKIFEEVLKEVNIDTILSYCQYSLNNTNLLNIQSNVLEKGVGIINASPLSMGLLSNRGAPSWHPASKEIKETCRKAVEYCSINGIDITKLAVQFSVQNKNISTTLVGTANPENIVKNIKWINEPINYEQLFKVKEILKPINNKIWLSGRKENN